MMKKRILAMTATVLCTLTLLVAGLAPAYASTPLSGEGDAVVLAEEYRWYYRTNHGVREMRLWSLTYGEWLTDWIPVPEGWDDPNPLP